MDIITACTMDCPDACSLIVYQRQDGKLGIRGNPDHPFTKGIICGKIKKHLLRLESPHRITYPMIRKNSSWTRISWDDALNICSEKLDHYRKQPESILHIHGEGAKGVLKQTGKLFFGLMGASRIRGSLCDAAGIVAYLKDFGSRQNHDPADIFNSQKIVIWGKDLSRSSIHMADMIQKARKKGAEVLSISPEGKLNAAFSDDRIRIRPGTDRFLAAAAIHRFLKKQPPGDQIISSTLNWEIFEILISEQSADELLKACDLDENNLDRLYCYYGGEKRCATIIGAGLQRYEYGGENVRFINALALISGNLGVSGGGSYFHLHSLKNLNTEWTDVSKQFPRRSFRAPLLGKEMASANPPVRMIWINGSNFVNQAPDIYSTINAFENVEFKVVVDAFMTDTAKTADIFLPSTLMFEQEDIIGSYLHDFVHYVSKVVEAPDEAKDDFWIFTQLGNRLSSPLNLPDPGSCFQKSLNTKSLSISLDMLQKQKYVRAAGAPIPYAGLKFDHPDQKYRLPRSIHPENEAPENYPLRLLSLIRQDAIHSQILPENQKNPPLVWVSPETLKNIGIIPDKPVYLVSPKGAMQVCLKEMESLYPNTVLYRRGDWLSCGGGVNRIIEAAVTDMGSGAAFYGQYVRLENRQDN
jgi:anaerobic selenocysteine-containing dehydrogenase